jgi:tetratricopeptide (TPR) repeat protein
LAEAYSLSGPPEAAYHYLRQALEANPERFVEDSVMLGRLGEAQHRLGQVNEARKTYQKVVELQERQKKEEQEQGEEGKEGAKVALRYGIALHDQGDPVGACGWYYRAIQLGREGGREGGN